jgi:hypothetical protein
MHKQKNHKKLRIGRRGGDSGLLLTGLGRGAWGEWERNNHYMNFGPNRVVRVPRSTTRLGPKLVWVLAITTRRTRSGFGVRLNGFDFEFFEFQSSSSGFMHGLTPL